MDEETLIQTTEIIHDINSEVSAALNGTGVDNSNTVTSSTFTMNMDRIDGIVNQTDTWIANILSEDTSVEESILIPVVAPTPIEGTELEDLLEEFEQDIEGFTEPEEEEMPYIEPIPVPVVEEIDPFFDPNSVEFVIPKNSETLSAKDNTIRFSGAVWAENVKELRVMLAGCGGIGSWVAMLLSRLDLSRIYLFDGDSIDSTNYAGQLFMTNQLGLNKATALRNNLSTFSNYNRVSTFGMYGRNEGTSPIMICGFDNMVARKTFYTNWKTQHANTVEDGKPRAIFIDGRLAAEEYQIFAIQAGDLSGMSNYETNYLFSDSEADATVCSYKQTSFMAAQIGSMMVNILVNFISNFQDLPFERDVPFLTTYDGENMWLKTIR